MDNLLETALRWPAPTTILWLAAMVMNLVIVSLAAHALGTARGRRIERLLEATRSSLEAAVHGVPDRRRRGRAPTEAGPRPSGTPRSRGEVPGCGAGITMAGPGLRIGEIAGRR